MSIKSDTWIRRKAQEQGMIEPFEAGQVRNTEQGKVISYGTSSYGYDVRCSDEFKIFTNINSAIVDPKNFSEGSFVDVKSVVPHLHSHIFLPVMVWYWKIPASHDLPIRVLVA
jgi:dCTP deaminase